MAAEAETTTTEAATTAANVEPETTTTTVAAEAETTTTEAATTAANVDPVTTTTTVAGEPETTTTEAATTAATVQEAAAATTAIPGPVAVAQVTATLFTEGTVAGSLVLPIAKSFDLPSNDTGNRYCEWSSRNSFTAKASMGTFGSRYTTAVTQLINAMPPAAFMQLTKSSTVIQRHTPVFLQLLSAADDAKLYGSCVSDANCSGYRKYCIEGMCRECSPDTWQSDCPASPDADMCSAATRYTCSQCLSDAGCAHLGASAVCRFTFTDNSTATLMPRKLCVACPFVPASAELIDVHACSWRCPLGTALNAPATECVDAPTCAATEFASPSSDASKFFTPGVNATDPVCRTCPKTTVDVCATLVDVASNRTGLVADLNKKNETIPVPCSHFTCKAGWHLNDARSKCLQCDYGVCQRGTTLSGCGGASAGTCTPCPGGLPTNGNYIDLTRLTINVTRPEMTCLSVCNDGFFKLSDGRCGACVDAEKAYCTIGQTLDDCGPGLGHGTCKNCAPAGSSMYFTGTKCQQASCVTRGQGCLPGTTLVGCGGVNNGTCEACPFSLPPFASTWSKGCDFMCLPGYFVDPTTRTCQLCDVNTMCNRGQSLEACGIDGVSRGTCVDCPQLGRGWFYPEHMACTAKRCDASICGETEKLLGCGYGQVGSCAACGSPPLGVHRFSRQVSIGGIRECTPRCNTGFQIVENATVPEMISCQPIRAVDDFYDDNA